MKRRNELKTGEKFNRLTVIRFNHKDKRHRRYYLFRCDCGIEKVIHGTSVTRGNTKSCGCYGREIKKRRLPNNRGVINHIILQYKRHAKNRDIKWCLKYEDVERIIQLPCYYCGEEKSNHKITKNCLEGYDHNGIDRVDSLLTDLSNKYNVPKPEYCVYKLLKKTDDSKDNKPSNAMMCCDEKGYIILFLKSSRLSVRRLVHEFFHYKHYVDADYNWDDWIEEKHEEEERLTRRETREYMKNLRKGNISGFRYE